MHSIRHPLSLVSFAVALTLLASSCGLLSDSNDGDSSSGTASDATVVQALLGTGLNEQQQLIGTVARAFPADITRVYAVMVLEGVDIGAEVTGRWYQLSVQDAPPEGAFVSEASVTLVEDNISLDGIARVSLDLGSNSGSLPTGDWVVRVYVDGDFVRTMGFVITAQLGGGTGEQPAPTAGPDVQPTAVAQPEPTQEPVPEAPQTYTVGAGDTLTVIAEQFKSPDEAADAYVARIVELNQLGPGSILFVGQVLQLPPSP